MAARQLADEAQRAARRLERERDDAIAGQRLDRDDARALELAAQQRLEGKGLGRPRGARARDVEAGDVRLGGEEEERGAGAAEQLERERSLGVDPHRFDACTGERRELPDDRLDLAARRATCRAPRSHKKQRPPGGGRGAAQ